MRLALFALCCAGVGVLVGYGYARVVQRAKWRQTDTVLAAADELLADLDSAIEHMHTEQQVARAALWLEKHGPYMRVH